MTNPNKWVRKAVYDAINNIDVGGVQIPCYDIRATNYNGRRYVLLSTQVNSTDRTKCGFSWLSSIELQVVTRWNKNAGSRVAGDDIAEAVLNALDPIALDVASGLQVLRQDIEMPGDLVSETESEIVSQIIIRYELSIN